MAGTALDPLTGIQKAAVLLTVLGDQAGVEILRHLSKEEVELVAQEVARMSAVSSTQAEAVLEEFGQLASAPVSDAGKSAGLLEGEHPQTIALVISLADSSRAAAMLRCFPAELRHDVLVRLALLDQIPSEIIREIAAGIRRRLGGIFALASEPRSGRRAVAEILDRLDPETSQEIALYIESQDRPLMAEIRALMFTFDDIRTLNADAVDEIVCRADRTLLLTALKGSDEQTRNRFLKSLPHLGEDIESLGPVRIRDVEAAQHQIRTMMKDLAAVGGDDHVL